jgi:hypothetical protein
MFRPWHSKKFARNGGVPQALRVYEPLCCSEWGHLIFRTMDNERWNIIFAL